LIIFRSKKTKYNFSWLVFDKFARASLNFLLFIFLARYLGPTEFGILNYLLALVFLFTSVSSLGINPVLTNILIKNKRKTNNNIISNSYILRFFSSLFGYLIFILFIIFLHGENFYLNYSIIIGLSIIIKSYEVLFSYFEAKSLSKYIVISQTISLVIVFSLIVFFLYLGLDIKYIYYCFLVDSLIILVLINIFFFIKERNFLFKLDFKKIYKIICKSFPVLLSIVSVVIYMRIDQVMINLLLSENDVGIYSVSVRIVEMFHFIPKIIMVSYLPILLISKNYNFELIKINSLLFKLSILVIFFIIILSKYITPILFGEIYTESVLTTILLSLSLIFVFIGVVNEHWYISKNLQKYYALNVFIGAITNIILNYFLIASFGISGAAYSTILTYLFIIFLFDIFNKKTRVLLKMKYKSIISL
tara:strand:+ start:2005 stop:3261 length:1257 start_codon:yes stop_codon:yes gene_type:complete